MSKSTRVVVLVTAAAYGPEFFLSWKDPEFTVDDSPPLSWSSCESLDAVAASENRCARELGNGHAVERSFDRRGWDPVEGSHNGRMWDPVVLS